MKPIELMRVLQERVEKLEQDLIKYEGNKEKTRTTKILLEHNSLILEDIMVSLGYKKPKVDKTPRILR